VGLAHTVVGSNEPPLEVAYGSIGKGDGGLRTFSKFRAEWLDASDISQSRLNEPAKLLMAVRIDGVNQCTVPGKHRGMIVLALKSGNHVHANSTEA